MSAEDKLSKAAREHQTSTAEVREAIKEIQKDKK